MLSELFSALASLLQLDGMPLYLADQVPDTAALPYATLEMSLPCEEQPGRITLTGWMHSGAAHQQRLAWGDALLTAIPAQGVRLTLAHATAVVMRARRAGLSCTHQGPAVGLCIPCDLYLYENP